MHTGSRGQEAPGKGVAVPVSAVSTRFQETKHTEEGTPSAGEGSLGSHSGIIRHHTQERTRKGDSLHTD